MGLYSAYEVDSDKEKSGIWVDLGGEAQNDDGSFPGFRIARASPNNKEWLKALEASNKKLKNKVQSGTLEEEEARPALISVFCKAILKDWRNVFNREGQAIPFSTDNAEKLLGDLPELFQLLFVKSNDFNLFKTEELDTAEKNL